MDQRSLNSKDNIVGMSYMETLDPQRPTDRGVSNEDLHLVSGHGVNCKPGVEHGVEGFTGAEVNMEAAITPEDVQRAGGLGATDDIGSILPAAADCTDFESTLLDSQDFEGPIEGKPKPGLGFKESEAGSSSQK